MDARENEALHDALAAELRVAQAAERLSAPKLEELTGLQKDTVRRILNGQRPVTVVELARLGVALRFTEIELIGRAKTRAQHELEGRLSSATNQSTRLREKLSLLASSLGKTTDSIYMDVVSSLSKQGFHFPRRAWQEMLSNPGAPARREVLYAIADALAVDPRYLTADDAQVDRDVESHLRFQRAMMDLGVQEVAARSLDRVDADELDEIQRAVTEAIRKHRTT